MVSMDLEDYIEEVKFQMTDFELLNEEKILEWEEKAREYVQIQGKKNGHIIKKSDDYIIIKLKEEEEMAREAKKYSHAVAYNQTGDYWKRFFI